MEHFFQTHSLCAKLDLVFFLLADRAMLIFNWVQTNREIGCRNMAAVFIADSLNAVAFSQQRQPVRKNGKFVKLQRVSAFLYPLGMDSLMLCTSFCGVGAFLPEPLIQKKSGSAWTIAYL